MGASSSLIGIGGGLYYVPTFLFFGHGPAVSGATSMFLELSSKLTTSLLFLINGNLNLQYLFGIGVFLMIGSSFAQITIKKMVKKYARQSFLTFAFVLFCYLA